MPLRNKLFLIILFTFSLAIKGLDPLCLQKTALVAGKALNVAKLSEDGKRITLETRRLQLNTPKEADFSELARFFSDIWTVQYTWFLLNDGEWTVEMVRGVFDGFAAAQLAGDRYDFVIHLKTHDELIPIGRCALFRDSLQKNWTTDYPKGENPWELGITLYREHWGKGLGEEAFRELIKYGFNAVKASSIRLRVDRRNKSMMGMLAKLKIPQVIHADADQEIPEAPFNHSYHHYLATPQNFNP